MQTLSSISLLKNNKTQRIIIVLQSVCDASKRRKFGNNINPGLESLSAETSEQ